MYGMKIEIWSDFVCPFCYIGKRQLDAALLQFPHREGVTVEFKSYELRPNVPKDIGKSMAEMLAERAGVTVEAAKENLARTTERGAANGLEFNFEQMIPTNTFAAHRLAKFAETQGKAAEFIEHVLDAYFRQSKHIGENEVLTALAVEVGLDKQEVIDVLADEKMFASDVLADQAKAKEIGVRGVPFFYINGKHTLAGSQSVEKFGEYLQTFWDEANEQTATNVDGDGCIDDSCDIPQKK